MCIFFCFRTFSSFFFDPPPHLTEACAKNAIFFTCSLTFILILCLFLFFYKLLIVSLYSSIMKIKNHKKCKNVHGFFPRAVCCLSNTTAIMEAWARLDHKEYYWSTRDWTREYYSKYRAFYWTRFFRKQKKKNYLNFRSLKKKYLLQKALTTDMCYYAINNVLCALSVTDTNGNIMELWNGR